MTRRISLLLIVVISTGFTFSCKQAPRDESSRVQFTVANRNAKNIAFVVGSPNDLPGVSRDVQNVSKMIQETKLGYELVSMNYATKSQILSKAREIGSQISGESTVFFFFAGHGTQDGLLVSQGNGYFTLKELVSSIKSGSNVTTFKRFIAVIDSCHSGQSVNGTEAMFLSSRNQPFSVDSFISSMVQGQGRSRDDTGLFNGFYSPTADRNNLSSRPFEQGLVVAAAKASQFSNDAGASIGGVFTANLMNAIKVNSSDTLAQILENAKQMTTKGASDQTPVWKATPESILNERFSGNDSNETVPNSPENNAPSVGPDPVGPSPNPLNNDGSVLPSPSPSPSPNPAPGPGPGPLPAPTNPNPPSDGGSSGSDLLRILISILNGAAS